jgi:outer membrane protein OmpA-like peptidoglycan-associated protein
MGVVYDHRKHSEPTRPTAPARSATSPVTSALAKRVLEHQSLIGNRATTQAVSGPLVVQRKRGGTKPDAAQPEQTAVDVTGLYDPLELENAADITTLRLNQAGRLIVGWHRVHGSVRRVEMEVTSHDESSVTARYQMHDLENEYPPHQGTAVFSRSGSTTTVQLSGHYEESYTRESSSPAASDASIEQLPATAASLIRARTRSPLTVAEEAHLLHVADDIRKRITGYLSASDRYLRRAKASRLSSAVQQIDTKIEAPGQRQLAIQQLSRSLASTTYTEGEVSRSHWDWLLVILASQPETTRRAQKALNVDVSGVPTDDASIPQRKFEWRLKGVGVAGDAGIAGLGMFIVDLEFKEVEPEPWRATYTGWMFQASAGPSWGVSIGFDTDWNEAASPIPYKAPNLVGMFDIIEVGAKASAGIGGGASGTALGLKGDGTMPTLILEPGTWGVSFGVQAGVELSGAVGGIDQSTGPRTIEPTPQKETPSATAAYGADTATHFPFNDPSLTDDGRQVLRQFIADELRSLSSPNSKLTISGHASTVGGERRNEELAHLRAQNVAQAIRDIAGDSLACDIEVQSFGERAAAAHGAQTGTPPDAKNPAWRRTDVELDGRLRVQLTGAVP